MLEQAGLSEHQRHAFEEARDLSKNGDVQTARNVLLEAGIDGAVIERVRTVLSAEHRSHHAALKAATDANDYQAFLSVIAGTPLADIIVTPEDFTRFKEAYDLRATGDRVGADLLFTALRIPLRPRHEPKSGVPDLRDRKWVAPELTASEQMAFAVAKAANDRDAMDAILEEAGMVTVTHSPKVLRDGRELGQ